ncbi:MAG TPA: hypothetical protein VFQ61_06085 [Polyangiaceae bacterium]|nr:hypothetical protein [Polyangiaceae bacterium]
MTRLVAVDSHVFQPRKQRLEGSEAILSHLKRHADSGNLVQGAAHLMRAARSDEERSFEAVDGEWVPVQAAPADTHSEPNAKQRAALENVIAELRAELLMLRASHQRLRERVATLEARIENAPLPEKKSARAELATPARLSEARSARTEVKSATAAHKPAEPLSELGLAPQSDRDLLGVLADLLGEDSGYAQIQRAIPESYLQRLGMYVSLLVDESGREVGAIVSHVACTAELGGRLAGLTPEERHQQARSGELSETVTQAMSEVCNALAGVLARSAKSPGVRCTPLEAFDPDRLGWLGEARQRLCLSKPDGGAFWVLGR